MIGQAYNAQELTIPLKATIQKTGRLGFTEKTAMVLHFDENTAIRIAPDTDNPELLYLMLSTKEDPIAFPLQLNSGYYSANTKNLFDRIKIDYKTYSYIYDLVREVDLDKEVDGMEVYSMKVRKYERKNNDTEE